MSAIFDHFDHLLYDRKSSHAIEKDFCAASETPWEVNTFRHEIGKSWARPLVKKAFRVDVTIVNEIFFWDEEATGDRAWRFAYTHHFVFVVVTNDNELFNRPHSKELHDCYYCLLGDGFRHVAEYVKDHKLPYEPPLDEDIRELAETIEYHSLQ
jgi:hypothetical protein